MGMYDSARISVKCPECGNIDENQDCQTKDLGRDLEVWRPGDFVTYEVDSIDCITNCEKCDCYFNLTINIREGLLTSEYVITEHWNHLKK
jgi:hypothetical protein